MKTLLSLACCTVLVTTLFAQSREAVAPPLAITRVNIVDVERGDVLRNRTVVIQGDVIETNFAGRRGDPDCRHEDRRPRWLPDPRPVGHARVRWEFGRNGRAARLCREWCDQRP